MKNYEHEFSGVAKQAYIDAVSLTEEGCRGLIRAFHRDGLDARTRVPDPEPWEPHGSHSLFSRIIETVASRTTEENNERPYILEWFGVVLKAFLDNGFRFLDGDSFIGARAMLELLSMDSSYVRTLFVKSFLAMGEMPHVPVYDPDREDCITSYGYTKENAIKAYEERNWDKGDPAHWLEDFRLMRASWRSEDFTGISLFHVSSSSLQQEPRRDTTLKSVFWIPEGERPRVEDTGSRMSRVTPFLGAIRLCCGSFDVVVTSKAEALVDPTMKPGMFGEELDVSEIFREFLGHRIVEAYSFIYESNEDRGFILTFEDGRTLRFRENRAQSALWKRFFIDEHYGDET